MERYVRTKTAQEAVKGREYEILQRTGVDWRPGQKAHCDCPYHGGKSDFRLDEKTGMIFCTCLPKPHSIFDHLSKMRGKDPQEEDAYETSKVEAMEMLGRHDLINERGGFVKPWHDFFKAHLLLNPPPELRDDSFVAKYLGARTKVAPEDAVLPNTPFAGIRELELSVNGEEVYRGPCAVFGMVDPDSGEVVGAIRTYLTADGTDKAYVPRPGAGPDDPPHDIKRMTPGSRTGGEVQFGDPKTATVKKVTEGVENGSAIALAEKLFGNGSALVTATGNTSYLKKSKVQQNIEELYIAGDRDDEPNEKGFVSHAGEKAGRALANLHVGRIPVHLALPGSPGTDTDWLNILERQGPSAVYDGIQNSPLYESSNASAKTKTPYQNQQDAPKTPSSSMSASEVESLYPVPVMNSEEFRYEHTNGEWWLYRRRTKKEEGEVVEFWVPACTPFAVTKRLVLLDGNDGPSYALRLAIQGMSGQLHEIDVSRSLLAKSGAADMKSLMFKAGLRTEGDGDSVAVAVLKSANPSKEVRVVARPGWHRIGEMTDPIFVSPTGEVIGNLDGQEVELTVNSRIPKHLAKAGTFEEWRQVAELISKISRTPHWDFALMAGFAGVLIDLLGLDTCGACFTGETSRGKSTAQVILTSPWCNPTAKAGALNHSARTTTNAVELMAQRSSGTVFSMDDLKNMKGDQISAFAYMVSGGTGKSRMNADTSLRTSYSWQTFVVLSAEKTLQQAIEEGGGEWLPGISVRIPDINVSGVNAEVPPATMNEVNKVKTNFGHAGPMFVQALIDQGLHGDSDELQRKIDALSVKIAGSENSELRRAAIPFAVVACAGGLAKAAGILPKTIDVDATITWGWKQFRTNNESTGGDRKDEALDTFNAWLSRNWNLTVVSKTESAPKREVEAWYDDKFVYVKKDTLEKVLPQTITVTDFVNRMKSMNILIPDGSRNVHKYTPGLNIGTCYWLARPAILEGQEDDLSTDSISPGVGPSPDEVKKIEMDAVESQRVVPMARYGRRR